jgi:hypothetical protein
MASRPEGRTRPSHQKPNIGDHHKVGAEGIQAAAQGWLLWYACLSMSTQHVTPDVYQLHVWLYEILPLIWHRLPWDRRRP